MQKQIVFSFDKTGSMSPCAREASRKMREVCAQLFKDIPDLEIAILGHGDYCDGPRHIELSNFSHDPRYIDNFLANIHEQGGGDAPECYEEVLHLAQAEFRWNKDAEKLLVMVGDEIPHPLGESKWNWRVELKACQECGIVVHGVQCLNVTRATPFYRELASATGGSYIRLGQFHEIVELIQATAYQQSGALEVFETRIKDEGRYTRSIATLLAALRGESTETASASFGSVDLTSVPPYRFQILHVDERSRISDFVRATGAVYEKGRGFYQFTKSETIQHYKEVVLRDKRTGDMFSGDRARELAGIPPRATSRVRPTVLDKYDVFVQSTSYTRVLLPDTLFLYEVA